MPYGGLGNRRLQVSVPAEHVSVRCTVIRLKV